MKGTRTRIGIIPYLEYRGINLPVRLRMRQDESKSRTLKDGLRYPVTDEGFLVYVLPGGENYTSNVVLDNDIERVLT